MSDLILGYVDESGYLKGRYRSVCLVAVPRKQLSIVERRLSPIAERTISEVKWKEVDGTGRSDQAADLFEECIDLAASGLLRVDVLLWDVEDSRHRVKRRDDALNLAIMQYHLISNVMYNRFASDSIWAIACDRQRQVDLQVLRYCLDRRTVNLPTNRQYAILEQKLENRQSRIGRLVEVDSRDHLMIQVADMFAGAAIFSYTNYPALKYAIEVQSSQVSLLVFDQEFTNSERARGRAVAKLYSFCKSRRLGVSLKSNQGFSTVNPNTSPINFWKYTPQHDEDKARSKASDFKQGDVA